MTALFDRYAIVDWSASNAPVTGKNSIWIAFAEREGTGARIIETVNAPTRAEAMARLRQFFRESLGEGKRVFAGFDFPFGYPAGAAKAITGKADWRALWAYFRDVLRDGDDNVNNRFEVAGRLNRDILPNAPMYWGRPVYQVIPNLPEKKVEPYPTALPERRFCEMRAPKAQPVWKLAYAGSVGSQALLGIARLEALRQDPEFKDYIAVWPFETDFSENLEAGIVLAEIYPGLVPTEADPNRIPDEIQVETLTKIFGRFDAEGRFGALLSAPADLPDADLLKTLTEEGWIAGLGHRLVPASAMPEDSYVAPNAGLAYIRDPAAIYAESFRIIEAEADLSGFEGAARDLVIRLIHACGMTDIVPDLVISDGAVEAGMAALAAGAPILCDAEMVAQGIIARNLPQQNRVVCKITDPRVQRAADKEGTTRSAAQVDLWNGQVEGAIVAIGNAPTALFRLLEKLDEGYPKPALIVGLPVGFVGAAESKDELIRDSRGIPFVSLRGRRGGSAMAAAAVNALAKSLSKPAG